jgi:C-terminal processing protease CtpA/Prc
MLAAMRARPGAQIALPATTLAYDRVQPRPRAVAILMDGVGASSTETFLLKARQSSRVRLFGQPTAGVVDYLNPAQHPLSCGVTLQSPTIRRSAQLPADAIDNIGIAPDVRLAWNEPDPMRAILALREDVTQAAAAALRSESCRRTGRRAARGRWGRG